MTKYFTLLFIFITYTSYCQTNYKKSTIINLTGDTIKGYIDYKNWNNNPEQIRFKATPSSPYEILQPKDIFSFEVEKEKYLSADVDVSYSPSDINRINNNSPKPETRTKTVFLKVLINGEKSLYSFKSSSFEDNFYIKNNDKFELLIYKKYVEAESFQILENLKYRKQIYAYLEHPLSLQAAIEKAQYSPSGLQYIFELYYKQKEKNTAYKSSKDTTKLTFGPTIGGMLRSYNIKDVSYFAPKTTPTFGVFLNIAIPRNFYKLNFYNDLLLVYTKYKDEKDLYESGFRTATLIDSYNFKVSSLKLSNSLRYMFHQQEDFGVFIQAGITNSFIVSINNEKTRYTNRYGTITEEKLPAIPNLRNHEQGYIFGIGAKKAHYALDFRFEKTNGISSTYKSNFNSFYILASYTF